MKVKFKRNTFISVPHSHIYTTTNDRNTYHYLKGEREVPNHLRPYLPTDAIVLDSRLPEHPMEYNIVEGWNFLKKTRSLSS
jgi:hypothetical protein